MQKFRLSPAFIVFTISVYTQHHVDQKINWPAANCSDTLLSSPLGNLDLTGFCHGSQKRKVSVAILIGLQGKKTSQTTKIYPYEIIE